MSTTHCFFKFVKFCYSFFLSIGYHFYSARWSASSLIDFNRGLGDLVMITASFHLWKLAEIGHQYNVYFFFFLCFSLPWDWSFTNLGEVLHRGCPSIAAWIFIIGGARLGFKPGTALQQSGMLTSRPHLTSAINIIL
jgi:hypothetical protein